MRDSGPSVSGGISQWIKKWVMLFPDCKKNRHREKMLLLVARGRESVGILRLIDVFKQVCDLI
jgi:hypothetical protein